MVLLILENQSGVRSSLGQMLKKHHDVLTCDDAASALALLSSRSVNFLLAEPESLDFIRKVQEVSPKTSVLLMAPDHTSEQTKLLEKLLVSAETTTAAIPETPGDLNATLEALEYRILQETLVLHHYNQVKAAEALGITRGALQYKMKKYHLADEDKKAA